MEVIQACKLIEDIRQDYLREAEGEFFANVHLEVESSAGFVSEIEKLFFIGWSLHLKRYRSFGGIGGGRARFSRSTLQQLPSTVSAFEVAGHISQLDTCIPQAQIGSYRPDFLLRRYVKHESKLLVTPQIIVECDGHEFHERTKEQASRDKERDRWFQGEGYIVLRFTGSDIWNKPLSCVKDVDGILYQRIYDQMNPQDPAQV